MTNPHNEELVAHLSPQQRARLLIRLTRGHSSAGRADVQRLEAPVEIGEPSRDEEAFDVLILGGGAGGLTLALQLLRSDPSLKVAVVEKNLHPVPEVTHKVGESTVEIAAHYLRDRLGLADHLERDQIRKFGLRMFFNEGSGDWDLATRRELGASTFPMHATYQLDRGRLENELFARCVAAGAYFIHEPVTAIQPAVALDSAAAHSDELQALHGSLHRVTVGTGAQANMLLGRWLIDATGRSRLLSRAIGADRVKVGHKASSAWLRIRHELDVSTFSADAAWRARTFEGDRAMSTVHLMGKGYWVWLIRLASGATSVGIVADETHHDFAQFNTLDRALVWLDKHEPALAIQLREHAGDVCDFRVMRNYSYGASKVFDGQARWALTGEASVFLDPLYSPGLDHIAIANNLIGDLIARDRAGEDVRFVGEHHDTLFRRIAEIWLAIYENQYSLMGDAVVMTSKVIWDTAFYWGVFGSLFFADRLRCATTMPSVVENLNEFSALSNRMQSFFREWAYVNNSSVSGDFVDLYTPLNFMRDLHESLGDDLDDEAFEARFADHLMLFQHLAGQLVDRVIANLVEQGPTDEQLETLHRWHADPLLAGWRRVFKQRRECQPLSEGWLPAVSTLTAPSATAPLRHVDTQY